MTPLSQTVNLSSRFYIFAGRRGVAGFGTRPLQRGGLLARVEPVEAPD